MHKVGKPFCMADLVRRASARKLRLHACGCMRLNTTPKTPREWVRLVEVAERYADGEINGAKATTAYTRTRSSPQPKSWDGDIGWAFTPDAELLDVWKTVVDMNRTFKPKTRDYPLALPRHRVFEELIGPDPLPGFAPEWRTHTVVTLAKQMYDAREFSAMPILADALQDVGCDDKAILDHCRHEEHPHLRGCWVVDLVLGKM